MMRKRRCSAEVKYEELGAVTLRQSPKNPRTCLLLYRTCRRPWRTRALNLRRISRDLATMLFVCSSCFHVSSVLIPQVIGFQSKTCCFVLHLPCNGSIWRAGAGAAGGTLRSPNLTGPDQEIQKSGIQEMEKMQKMCPVRPCPVWALAAINPWWGSQASVSCFHVSNVLIPQAIRFQSKTCCFMLHLPCNGSIWRPGAVVGEKLLTFFAISTNCLQA